MIQISCVPLSSTMSALVSKDLCNVFCSIVGRKSMKMMHRQCQEHINSLSPRKSHSRCPRKKLSTIKYHKCITIKGLNKHGKVVIHMPGNTYSICKKREPISISVLVVNLASQLFIARCHDEYSKPH